MCSLDGRGVACANVEAEPVETKHRMNYNPKLPVTVADRPARGLCAPRRAVAPALADAATRLPLRRAKPSATASGCAWGGRSRRCRAIRCNPGPSTGPCACGSTTAMPAASPDYLAAIRTPTSPRSCAATGCACWARTATGKVSSASCRRWPCPTPRSTAMRRRRRARPTGAPAVDQRPGSAAGLRALVDQLVAAGDLTVEEVWQRVRRLFEAKRVGAARSAAAYLPASEGFDGRGLESIAQSPARHLDKLPAGLGPARADAKWPCSPCSAWRATTRRMRPGASPHRIPLSAPKSAPTPGARSPGRRRSGICRRRWPGTTRPPAPSCPRSNGLAGPRRPARA
jgi:hypothetical protein